MLLSQYLRQVLNPPPLPCPVLFLNHRKILNCFRGQINALKAKKQVKAATATKPQEPELPKTLDQVGPKAEPPVKFLSLTGSTSAAQESLPQHGATMYKQGSGSSSGIPVGPVLGQSHSVTPWAEGVESAPTRDQDLAFPMPPTAASLAGLAQQQQKQQQGALYRDSNSFRQWAAGAGAQGTQRCVTCIGVLDPKYAFSVCLLSSCAELHILL